MKREIIKSVILGVIMLTILNIINLYLGFEPAVLIALAVIASDKT